jgi:cbb3-type cytochrome oxidase maturation protein
MTVLFLVLPLAVALSALAAGAFLWATRAGQFDDLDTPAVRLLCDDLAVRTPSEPSPMHEELSPRTARVD